MKKRLSKNKSLIGWLLAAPALLVFSIFMFWPLLYTVYLSFYKWNLISTKTWVGFNNYINILTSKDTVQLLINTLLYILVLVLLNFVLPFVLAFINSVVMKKRKDKYKVWLFSSSVISLVVDSIIFQFIFNPISGPIALLLSKFDITMTSWSKTQGMAIVIISLVAVYKTFGYNFLVLLSGVNSVDPELIEAARLEKTPNRKIFSKIVVPLTSATTIYVLIMSIVQGMQYVFTPLKVLTQGSPNTTNIIYAVYQEAILFSDSGAASALSIISMIIFLLLLYLEFKYVEKGVHYEN